MECYHKEFFGLGIFIMGIVWIYFEIIYTIIKHNKILKDDKR